MKNIYLLLFSIFFLTAHAGYAAAELPTTDMEMTDELIETTMTVKGSSIQVKNGSGLTLEIYSITGVKVGSYQIENNDQTVNTQLERGCYIVKVGKLVRKISVL